MQFEPMGGFPPIIISDDVVISDKTLESRGFQSTNIVNIGNIMKAKKKEDFLATFDMEDESGFDPLIENLFGSPQEFKKVGTIKKKKN